MTVEIGVIIVLLGYLLGITYLHNKHVKLLTDRILAKSLSEVKTLEIQEIVAKQKPKPKEEFIRL